MEDQECRVNFCWSEEALSKIKSAASMMAMPYEDYIKQVLVRQADADLDGIAKEKLEPAVDTGLTQLGSTISGSCFTINGFGSSSTIIVEEQSSDLPGSAGSNLPWESLISSLTRARDLASGNLFSYPEMDLLESQLSNAATLLRCLKGAAPGNF